MAVQTAATVPFHALALGRQDMRIVARGAAHSAVAGLVATALMHLLDMANGLAAAVPVRRGDEDRHELIERESGPIGPQRLALVNDARLPLEMTLFTHGFPQPLRQSTRIYDCPIPIALSCTALMCGDVLLAGSVAALATNWFNAWRGQLELVHGVGFEMSFVTMTKKARFGYDSIEVLILLDESGRESPGFRMNVPADR